MTQTTTRRDLLRMGTSVAAYGAGAALVAGGCALAGEAKGAVPTVNPRLLRAIALRDRAEEAMERFDTDIEMPARKAWLAGINALPPIPDVPHQSVATTFVNVFGDEVRFSTDSPSIPVARLVVNDPTWADTGDETWRQAHRELAALVDERDAIAEVHQAKHDAALQQLREKHGIDRLTARSDALGTREYALWQAVVTMPALSLADVLTKLDFAQRTRGTEMADHVLDNIHADVQHLAGGEA